MEIKQITTEVNVRLVPVKTVHYGLMGQQTYEEVELVADNQEG